MEPDADNQRQNRAAFRDAQRIVVKLGTAVLTNQTDSIDRGYLHDFAAVTGESMADDRQIIIVSSGSVAAGVDALGLDSRPSDVSEQQAAAAAGQPLLMSHWREAFDVRQRRVAQLLVGRGDFDSRERYLNIRNCLAALLDRGVAPIVNENDTVATDEISLGDNDILASKLAVTVAADALIILTTAAGVLDADEQIVSEASTTQELAGLVRQEKSRQGRGGMGTKVEAARIASLSGIPTIIAPGRPASNLRAILDGEDIGTFIHGARARHAGRRLWISMTATPTGTIEIDEGAADAVIHRGASLLARGVCGVTGRFEVGDVLLIRDRQGREIGRGLSNLSADELRQVVGRDSREFEAVLGRQAHEEVIHRDNLAVTEH